MAKRQTERTPLIIDTIGESGTESRRPQRQAPEARTSGFRQRSSTILGIPFRLIDFDRSDANPTQSAYAPPDTKSWSESDPAAQTGRHRRKPDGSFETPRKVRYSKRKTWKSALALLGLFLLLIALGQLGKAAFHAQRDGSVTPVVVTPDSDLVLPSKLSLSRLQTERATIEARIHEASEALLAAELGQHKLQELRRTAQESLEMTAQHSSSQRWRRASLLRSLSKQRQLLERQIAEQIGLVAELERNVGVGLARRADLLREQNTLNQMRIAALENDRERRARASAPGSSASWHGAGRELASTDTLERRDQVVRIELELMRLDADRQARALELSATRDELDKIDRLIDGIRRRPIFRAVEAGKHIAFIPNDQLSRVEAGAVLYVCKTLGMFGCQNVGKLSEVVPGEVAIHDRNGAPLRGQYALLDLRHADGAREETLRVRPLKRD